MRQRVQWLAAGAILLAQCLAVAGEPPKPEEPAKKGEVVLSWDQFVKITGYDPAVKGSQVLTIPWSEVQSLLGVQVERVGQAATVDLPWQEFKALLEWSIRTKAGKAATPAPTDFVVASSEYSGKLSDDGAELVLKATVQILRQAGWSRIPILPGSVAITKVTLPQDVFLNSTGKSYELLTEKAGSIDVEIGFSVAVEKEAGINRVNFTRALTGSSIIDFTIARADVDVEVSGAQSTVAKPAQGATQVAAAIPTSVPLNVSWERALPKVEAAPTKMYAETRTLVGVAEGVMLCQESVKLNILHTAVREVKLKVPDKASVLTVQGTGVQDWRVDAAGELQVVFRAEMLGSQSLTITYERLATDSTEVPIIAVQGVEREKGFVGVVAVTNVEIASESVTGARTIDVRQLPPDLVAMTQQPILLGFRYVGQQPTIPLTIKRHGEVSVLVTIVDSALYTSMQLNDGRRITKVAYSVRNNRNQFLRLKMPEGAEIWSVEVSGNTAAPAKDDEGNVLIPLVRSASGATELASFPVDVVYVETPAAAASTKGKLRVDLPSLGAPVMHIMFNYYLPAEGKYTVGWFGGSGFTGPLRLVEQFTSLATGQVQVVVHDAEQQAQQMESQVQARVEAQAKAAGATPIRVRLPINGKLFRLEKILALPQDTLWFEVAYRGWKPAK